MAIQIGKNTAVILDMLGPNCGRKMQGVKFVCIRHIVLPGARIEEHHRVGSIRLPNSYAFECLGLEARSGGEWCMSSNGVVSAFWTLLGMQFIMRAACWTAESQKARGICFSVR